MTAQLQSSSMLFSEPYRFSAPISIRHLLIADLFVLQLLIIREADAAAELKSVKASVRVMLLQLEVEVS